MLKKIVAASLLVATGCLFSTAAKFGYCTDDISRSNIFRMGSTETQGMAIKLDAQKLSLYQGHSITGLSVAFGSSRTTDGTVDFFVTGNLTDTPLLTQNAKITRAERWLDFTFDTPYVITGDEGDIFIGYTCNVSVKTSVLMADHAKDIAGHSYVYSDGQWLDTNGLGCGNASIRVEIADAPPTTDVILKPIEISGYFKTGEMYTPTAQVLNFGTEPIQSMTISAIVGDDAPVTLRCQDVNIAQGQTLDVTLPEIGSEVDGFQSVQIEVVDVNGQPDASTYDNVYASTVFYYPRDMERNILLEGFTGQACSNCPGGHTTIHNFIESVETPIIEIMHHAGYQPDFMTMDADVDYTYFYGSTSTYAPAVMLNRTHVSTISNVPVIDVSVGSLQGVYNHILGTQPYVSLGIESALDPDTRQLNVTVHTLAHNDLPQVPTVLNVVLIQDGIVSMQVPYGTNYTHNSVFRGTLTGNSWGLLLDESSTQAGGTATWSTSFTIPEAIFADYYNWDKLSENERIAYSIPAVIDNMSIVAYVGAYDQNSFNGHTIYNCVSTPVGKSHIQGGISEIESVVADSDVDCDIRVIGRSVIVNGDYDFATIYGVNGVRYRPNSTLTPGLYLINVAKGAKSIVKKVIVR